MSRKRENVGGSSLSAPPKKDRIAGGIDSVEIDKGIWEEAKKLVQEQTSKSQVKTRETNIDRKKSKRRQIVERATEQDQ